jgi:predicted GTPase
MEKGISALKDFLLTFDEIGDEEIEDKKHPKIAIVGKPNVGKVYAYQWLTWRR